MCDVKKILFARHAETGSAYKHRYVGTTDVSISEVGVSQARDLAERIKLYPIDTCFCSPMLRCKQTFEAIVQEISCEEVCLVF